jgi:hypothetical protein
LNVPDPWGFGIALPIFAAGVIEIVHKHTAALRERDRSRGSALFQ